MIFIQPFFLKHFDSIFTGILFKILQFIILEYIQILIDFNEIWVSFDFLVLVLLDRMLAEYVFELELIIGHCIYLVLLTSLDDLIVSSPYIWLVDFLRKLSTQVSLMIIDLSSESLLHIPSVTITLHLYLPISHDYLLQGVEGLSVYFSSILQHISCHPLVTWRFAITTLIPIETLLLVQLFTRSQ